MEQQVILKSNRYGINLILNENLPFEELLDAIILKFHESDKFFKNASIAITFSGRHLSTEEEIRIIDAITEQTSIHIICVLDSDEQKELDTQAQIEEFLRRQEESTGQFYKGTLRSGQSLESDASVVVVGDVNPGASVCAKGNVVVLGCAKGYLSAGCDGDDHAFVAALDMQPMQIRIGKHIARSADGEPEKKKKLFGRSKNNDNQPMEAQIAFVEDENIYIEPISKALLNEIIV